MRRLPRFLRAEYSSAELTLHMEPSDLVGGDICVFADGTEKTVNGVSPWRGLMVVTFGESPECAPRPHSGRQAPLFQSDGVTPYGGG